MTTDLDEVWRSAQLWPKDAKGYLAHLKEAGTAVSGEDAHNAANLNMTASSARDGLADLGSRRSDAFSRLGRDPSVEAAERAYRLLVAHRNIDSAVLKQLGDDESQHSVAESFLLFVILNAPHKVAIKNAIVLFVYVGQYIDADALRAFCIDSFLVRHLYPLCHKANLGEADKDRLVRAMAQDGCFDAQCHLYERLTDDSPDDLRRYLLRHAQFAIEPPFEVYNGFDLAYDAEYHAAILLFAKRTRLEAELGAQAVDDELIAAALKFFSGLSSCWFEDVPWGAFEEVIPATDMLGALLDHLQERELSLSNMFDLSHIYDRLFSDSFLWTQEEPQKLIAHENLIAPQEVHVQLGLKIRDVFEFPANRNKLQSVLTLAESAGAREAMLILLRLSTDDPFDVVYPYLQETLSRNTAVIVGSDALSSFFNAAAKSAEKAQKAADWCADYCRLKGGGRYYTSSRVEFLLPMGLRLIKAFPGIGSSLVRVGLDTKSPFQELAIDVLNAWQVEFWPPGLVRDLYYAVEREQKSLELLQSVRRKLRENAEQKDLKWL